jgi:hypothetical protein
MVARKQQWAGYDDSSEELPPYLHPNHDRMPLVDVIQPLPPVTALPVRYLLLEQIERWRAERDVLLAAQHVAAPRADTFPETRAK